MCSASSLNTSSRGRLWRHCFSARWWLSCSSFKSRSCAVVVIHNHRVTEMSNNIYCCCIFTTITWYLVLWNVSSCLMKTSHWGRNVQARRSAFHSGTPIYGSKGGCPPVGSKVKVTAGVSRYWSKYFLIIDKWNFKAYCKWIKKIETILQIAQRQCCHLKVDKHARLFCLHYISWLLMQWLSYTTQDLNQVEKTWTTASFEWIENMRKRERVLYCMYI